MIEEKTPKNEVREYGDGLGSFEWLEKSEKSWGVWKILGTSLGKLYLPLLRKVASESEFITSCLLL